MQLNGSCYVLMAYDIGTQVNIDACVKLIDAHTERTTIAPRHRAPKHFEYSTPPLRLSQKSEQIAIGAFKTAPSVDLSLFDFGTVSLCYTVPFETTLDGLLDLSAALYENAAIKEDSKKRVEQFMATIKPAVVKPVLSGFVEDYLIFELKRNPLALEHHHLLNNHRLEIAQILRSEKLTLSTQEIDEALSEQISYTPGDSVIVNWNAAFVYDDDADDVRAVLEYGNLQLLEMRYLDRELDQALDKSYDMLTRRQSKRTPLIFKAFDGDLKQVAQMQAEAALMFEGISSGLKLLGDQYLSRVYGMAARRFYLKDWSKGIDRKIGILESIYQKLEDKIDSMRNQLMELTIVLLIMFEIAMSFMPK